MIPCLLQLKPTVEQNRRQEWIDKIDQACRISGYDFRTEIIKKSTGAVCKVVMTIKDCSDGELLLKLRNAFQMPPPSTRQGGN